MAYPFIWLVNQLGVLIAIATEITPFVMGVVIAVVMGILLTMPTSSAAIWVAVASPVLSQGALAEGYEDIETMIEMGYEENDPSLIPEIQEMLDEFIATYESIRMKTLLSGEYDKNKAIVSLHAGAGGTESCDWASMLFRMYSRWADKKGFSLTIFFVSPSQVISTSP